MLEPGTMGVDQKDIHIPGLSERHPKARVVYYECPATCTHRVVVWSGSGEDARPLAQRFFTRMDIVRFIGEMEPRDFFWKVVYEALAEAFPEDLSPEDWPGPGDVVKLGETRTRAGLLEL